MRSQSMSTKTSEAAQESHPGRYAETQKPSLLQDIVALLIKIFIILTVFVLLFTFLFGIFTVKDLSMNPALQDGDLVFFYRLTDDFVSSDAVVVEYEGEKQVRRVVAVSGDTVDITENGLFINGAFISEQSRDEILLYEDGVTFPVTVPEGHVFVLADKRDGSADSRMYGTVPQKDILGKVSAVIRQRNI